MPALRGQLRECGRVLRGQPDPQLLHLQHPQLRLLHRGQLLRGVRGRLRGLPGQQPQMRPLLLLPHQLPAHWPVLAFLRPLPVGLRAEQFTAVCQVLGVRHLLHPQLRVLSPEECLCGLSGWIQPDQQCVFADLPGRQLLPMCQFDSLWHLRPQLYLEQCLEHLPVTCQYLSRLQVIQHRSQGMHNLQCSGLHPMQHQLHTLRRKVLPDSRAECVRVR